MIEGGSEGGGAKGGSEGGEGELSPKISF